MLFEINFKFDKSTYLILYVFLIPVISIHANELNELNVIKPNIKQILD